MTQRAERIAKALFGKSESQQRLSFATLKSIISDIVILYQEFRKASGPGSLVFNTMGGDQGVYMTPADIRNDIANAQELQDDGLGKYLTDLLEKVAKFETDTDKAVITLVTERGISTHILDLNDAEGNLRALSLKVLD